MNWDETLQDIISDEKFETVIYLDKTKKTKDFPKGIPTVGPSLLLKPGYSVPFKVLNLWTNYRFRNTIEEYHRFEEKFNIKLDSVRCCVICGMLWNMGFVGVCKFKNMIKALQKEDYEEAANQIIDSKIHRNLNRIRGKRKFEIRTEKWARMMRKGGGI